jgi:hypothetical protein
MFTSRAAIDSVRLVFEHTSTTKIKMNHISTMLCGNFIGMDKLERVKLLQSDPLFNEFAISIYELETVSRFLGNFSSVTLCDQRIGLGFGVGRGNLGYLQNNTG